MGGIYVPVGCDLLPWLKDGGMFGYDEDLRDIVLGDFDDLDTYRELIICMKPCWFWQVVGWDKYTHEECEGGIGAECDENDGKLPDDCRSTVHGACLSDDDYGVPCVRDGEGTHVWQYDCDYPFAWHGPEGIFWGGGCHDDASNANVSLQIYDPCEGYEWCRGEDEEGFMLQWSLEGLPLSWTHWFPFGTTLAGILCPWCNQGFDMDEIPECEPPPSTPDYQTLCYDPVAKLNLF